MNLLSIPHNVSAETIINGHTKCLILSISSNTETHFTAYDT